jgi:hypothetical protein
MNLGSLSGVIAHWPTDWIIIGAFAAVIALDTMRSGSARAATLALVAPLSLLMVNMVPQAFIAGQVSQQLTAPAAQVLLFAVIFGVLFLVIHRIIFSFSENGGPIQALIAGLSATAVFVVVWLQVPALESLWHFGPQVQLVFGEVYRLWWLIGAYIALAFVRS